MTLKTLKQLIPASLLPTTSFNRPGKSGILSTTPINPPHKSIQVKTLSVCLIRKTRWILLEKALLCTTRLCPRHQIKLSLQSKGWVHLWMIKKSAMNIISLRIPTLNTKKFQVDRRAAYKRTPSRKAQRMRQARFLLLQADLSTKTSEEISYWYR